MLSPFTLPPIILISPEASSAIFPLVDVIPPFTPPELLLVILPSDLTMIFPFATIFPFPLLKDVLSVMKSPPTLTVEVPPLPWPLAILSLDSFEK